MNTLICLLLGVVWGIFWAVILQETAWGRYMANRRAWLTVVIGIAVDLAILALVLDLSVWLTVAGVIAASSVGIIGRSLINEWQDHQELMEDARGHQDQGR